MNVLDLFSGIGGFSLGLERAGMRTVAFCEIEPYARAVLAKHWPGVPCYDDVCSLTADRLRADGIIPDVICGGFPCQDISVAGKGVGLSGDRSGLWDHQCRLVSEIRPAYLIVENVAALRKRGLGRVLGDLAEIGYDAEWHCIPASALGAPHQRDRLWIIAYPNSDGLQEREHVFRSGRAAAGSQQAGREAFGISATEVLTDAQRREQPLGWEIGRVGGLYQSFPRDGDWVLTAEPVLGRGADGIPGRLDRLKCLGNSVVPQIPQIIGEAIMAHRNLT